MRKQESQTDFEFLTAIAKENGWSMFIDHTVEPRGYFLRFQFLIQDYSPDLALRWGQSLTEFTPRITTVGDIAGVTARVWVDSIKTEFVIAVSWDYDRAAFNLQIFPSFIGDTDKILGPEGEGKTISSEAVRVRGGAAEHPEGITSEAEQPADRKRQHGGRSAHQGEQGDSARRPRLAVQRPLSRDAGDAHDRRQRLQDQFSGAQGSVVRLDSDAQGRVGTAAAAGSVLRVAGEAEIMEDQLLSRLESIEMERQPPGFAVAPGIVTNNLDLIGEGRVQVKIPSLPAFEPWARVSSVGAGSSRGLCWIPQIDDEVLVAFSQNDPSSAFVLGGLWSTRDRAPLTLPTDFLTKRVIKTGLAGGLGHEVEFDDLLQIDHYHQQHDAEGDDRPAEDPAAEHRGHAVDHARQHHADDLDSGGGEAGAQGGAGVDRRPAGGDQGDDDQRAVGGAVQRAGTSDQAELNFEEM